MKYLYGDSVPSPIRFDFLTAFETFVDVAVKAVRIEQEIGQAQAAVDLAVEAREEALSIVESFHQKVMVYLDALLDEQQDPNTSVYVRQLREHGDKVVAEARNNCRVAMELAVKERGAEQVFVGATHGVFSGQAIDRLSAAPFDEILVTDTIPLSEAAAELPHLKVLSVANLLGEAIRRIHNNESVSSMFT